MLLDILTTLIYLCTPRSLNPIENFNFAIIYLGSRIVGEIKTIKLTGRKLYLRGVEILIPPM